MKDKIFQILDNLDIRYENFEHAPVFTCDDDKGVNIPAKRVKSLLLRNKKSTNFYMVVLEDQKRLQTNVIRNIFDDSKISFLEEEVMMNKIWLRPGSVSPFALINNLEKDIRVVIDEDLKNEIIWLHPLQNTDTTVLDMKDLEKFLDHIWFKYSFEKL